MFAVLHVADFWLQAVLRMERGLAGRPAALLDETTRPPSILACTREAEAAGVEPGQTAPQAMARCAGIVLRARQPAAEAEARAGLVAAAFSVSPQVEETAPGVCTLQVSGLSEERRPAALRAALRQLEQMGLGATAGLAATPLLALYAARFGGAEANRAANRLVYWPAGDERTFLRTLPLAVAGPEGKLAEILASWGVRTLGDLTALKKADVAQRLGPAGLALWERAAGETTRPLHRASLPQIFVAAMEVEYEIETLEPLLFILRRFIDRLAIELRNAGFVAGGMTLGLTLSDDTQHERMFRLPEPTAQEEILFRVLHTYLETLHTAATVRRVALECHPVRPLERQQGLFESGLRDPHGFTETLARVAAIVGAGEVGTPVVENTHRPDAVSVKTPPMVIAVEESLPRPRRGPPLRRYRPALSATVELNGTAPTFVWASNIVGTVRALAGPWRGSGDWWDANRQWRREEWDVELETGGVYRLVHVESGWFVEGEYD